MQTDRSHQATRLDAITGRYDPNRAEITAPLIDWGDRTLSQAQIIARVQGDLNEIPGVQIFAFNLHQIRNIIKSCSNDDAFALVLRFTSINLIQVFV